MSINEELSQNDLLLNKLTQTVIDNLNNEQFGVVDLSEEAGMSRSHLHRKLKMLKGQSVSQFIRNIRLEEALKLLQNDVGTASEIAYRVGFNSPTYFHKCFNEHYGYSPGDVKKRTEDETENQTEVHAENKTELNSINEEKEVIDQRFEKELSFKDARQKEAVLEQKKQIPIQAGYKKYVYISIGVILLFLIGYLIFPSKQITYDSIAVLPLQNFTGDKEQDYFVNGLHDELIGALGKISALRVISRLSTLRYQKSEFSLQEIASELDVKAVLTGSVIGTGDHKRIQLQLIEVFPEERHLWSKEYEQDLRNILVLQSDVVQNVVNEVHIAITDSEKFQLTSTREVNPEAYKAYLKGIFHWDKLTEEDLNTAMRYFELALEIDPNYALAYSGISLVWVGRLQQGLTSYFEGGAKMKVAALKAKASELENIPAEVHYMLGTSNCWVEWNYKEAEKEYRRAIAKNPNFSGARAYFSHVLNILHQPEEAMENIELALELDPFNPLFKALYGMNLMYTRQYDKAIEILTNTTKYAPTDPVVLSTLRTAYHMKGMYAEALKIWETSYAAKGDDVGVKALLEGYKNGSYKGALENLAKTLIKRSETSYVTPWKIATLYTRAGNKQEAIDWLEKAFLAHDSNMPYI